MKDIGVYVADFFAFISWIATVRGNKTLLKNHKIFGIVLNGILGAVRGGTQNDGAKSGGDGSSGSGGSSS